MTIDTLGYMKRLEAAGVPRPQAEAHAEAMRDEITPQVATKLDLDAAVGKLEAKIDSAVGKLDARIASEVGKLDAKIDSAVGKLEGRFDATIARMEAMMLRQSVAIILGVLAAGSFIVRFLR